MNLFFGERRIKREWLQNRVDEVHRAFAPVKERIEEARRERAARELAERNRQRLRRETLEETRRSEGTYKGFTESELHRIHENLQSKGLSYEAAFQTMWDMLTYADTTAVLREWVDNN